jgi:hypothetical protein
MSTGRDATNTRPISRVTVVLLIVPVVLLWLDARHEPYAQFTIRAALAGDQDRWRAAIARVSAPALSTALTWDYVFIASWLFIVVPMCKWAIDQWGPGYRHETAWRFLWLIALAAAVFDLIEDVLLGLFHGHVPPSVALVILSTVSWLKLAAYAVSIVGIVLCVLGPAVLPLLRARVRAVIRTSTATPAGLPDTHPAPMTRADAGAAAEGIGICLSGGGIRAAGIAFGALRSLERGAASPLGRARWVAAVSGGGYTACGWWVTRGLLKPVPDPFFATTSAWPKTVMKRVRYLENPVGGLAWGVVQVLARMVLVLGAVFGVAYLVGLYEGLLIRSDAVQEHFTFKTGLFPARLSTPGLTLVTAGIVLFAVSGFLLWRSGFTESARALVEPAKLLLLAGAGLLFALVVGPAIVKYVPGLLYKAGHPGASNDAIKSNTGKGAGLFGVLTSLGIVAAIVGLVKRTVQRIWLRLGGVLLALAWLLVVEQVMQHVVVNRPAIGPWLTGSVWAVLGYVAFALLVLADSVPAHQETLNGIYRKRLAGTFALGPGTDGEFLEPVAAKREIE